MSSQWYARARWHRLVQASVVAGSTFFCACGTGISPDPGRLKDNPGSVTGDAGADVDAPFDAEDDADDAATSDVSIDGAAPDAEIADAAGEPPSDGEVDTTDGRAADAIDGARDVSLDGTDATTGRDAASDERDAVSDDRDAGGDARDESSGNDAGVAIDGDACGATGCDPSTYFVDAHAAPGGDGSELRPFTTITAAIDAYKLGPAKPKTVRVAAGTYDETLGERFPLELHGLSLEGAGRIETVIVGAGFVDHGAQGGVLNGRYMVTIMAGDRTLPTSVSNVTVIPPNPVPIRNYIGVFCDRGSATGEVPSPAGQTLLDRLTIGPGYDTAVVASTSTNPSITGCNLSITGSTLTGGWRGLRAGGCVYPGAAVPVLVEIGGADPNSGNTFSWLSNYLVDNNGEWGYGAQFGGCVVQGSIRNNTFTDSECAVFINTQESVGTRDHYAISRNLFQRLSWCGIHALGDYHYIDELSDNRFVEISGLLAPNSGAETPAVYVGLLELGKVRRNQFVGNDGGITLVYDHNMPGTAADLGTASDPGNNIFRCNSSGGDVSVWGDDYDPFGWNVLHLAGNAWDHVPPTIQSALPYSPGVDIATGWSPGVTFDVANSVLATAACPSDREPGP